jgi:uncharacterized protein (DUF2267 family)
MTQATNTDLTPYYEGVRQAGKLRTASHAQQWSKAVLNTLGLNLDRKTKKQLARALPADLAESLTRIFWLLHFRDPQLSLNVFLNQVSRRSGNSDTSFARYPTAAVFSQIKRLIDADLSEQVAQTLSPEVRQLWQQA